MTTTLPEPSHGVPHARIAATAAALLRLRRRRQTGMRLTAAEVDALVDAPAMRAVLCEECRACRACGCTGDFTLCSTADGDGCHWVEPDLCSACAEQRGEAR